MKTKKDIELDRRVFLLGSSTMILTSSTMIPGCRALSEHSNVPSEIVSGVAGILKPLSVVWVIVDGVATLVNRIVEKHRELKDRRDFKVGEGVSIDSGLAENGGSDLPDGSSSERNIYVEAVERVRNGDEQQGLCTLVGKPILPVVAGRSEQKIEECQVFESEEYRRPMKFLLVPGRHGLIAHPIPEPIADYFVSKRYCLGTPLSDPVWSNCSCGRLLVSQRFAGYPKGVIYAFDDDDPIPGHLHDGSTGAKVGVCKLELKKDDPTIFDEPSGELCVKE